MIFKSIFDKCLETNYPMPEKISHQLFEGLNLSDLSHKLTHTSATLYNTHSLAYNPC